MEIRGRNTAKCMWASSHLSTPQVLKSLVVCHCQKLALTVNVASFLLKQLLEEVENDSSYLLFKILFLYLKIGEIF